MNELKKFLNKLNKSPGLIILSAEIIFGVIISFFTFHIFWEMSETVLRQEKFFFDSTISGYFYEQRSPFLTSVMQFLSFIGMDGIIFFSLLIPIFLFWKRKNREAILFSIIIVFGLLLNIVLKAATQRPRPDFEPLSSELFYSFPSGHSMSSFIFFMTLAYFYYHFTRKKKSSIIIFLLAAVIILGVGISRIYLGVHYPSDVIAGYLAGLLWIVFVLLIDKSITFFELFKRN